MLLPKELYELIWHGLDAKTYQIQYSRVIMPLSALLDGDFFNLYIKTGTTVCICVSIVVGSIVCSSQDLNSLCRQYSDVVGRPTRS